MYDGDHERERALSHEFEDDAEEDKEDFKEKLIKKAKELILFYTTAFFVLLAIFSALAFCFLVPFVIDPALATLQQQFSETNCTTLSGHYLEGKHNCSWTSCSEGCTKEIFTCWQIEVQYIPSPNDFVARKEEEPSNIEVESHIDQTWRGRLLPNVRGCGYPPRVVCDRFAAEFGVKDYTFTCFYSRVDRNLVITHLDLKEVYRDLIYSTAIPLPTFLLALLYLILAYTHIYSKENGSGEGIEELPVTRSLSSQTKLALALATDQAPNSSAKRASTSSHRSSQKRRNERQEEDRKAFRKQSPFANFCERNEIKF